MLFFFCEQPCTEPLQAKEENVGIAPILECKDEKEQEMKK